MIDGQKFYENILNLIFCEKFKEAEDILYNSNLEIQQSEVLRVERLKKILSEAKLRFKSKPTGLDAISVEDEGVVEPVFVPKDTDLLGLLNQKGLYCFEKNSFLRTSFEDDFSNSSSRFKRLLRHAKFHVPIETINSDKFRIAKDVRFSCYDGQMAAYIFDKNKFDRNESARMAKVLPFNFLKPVDRRLEVALCLPVPHQSNNYFHFLSEVAFAVRFVKRLPEWVPIIYFSDFCNILSSLSEKLGINKRRFVRMNDVSGCLIENAIIPFRPNYFWDRSVFNFFQNSFCLNECHDINDVMNFKFYISRRGGSRSIKNEADVEDFVQKKGYIVLRNENLTFNQQAFMYSHAAKIVSPHGAGETNIVFMKPDTEIVELFDESYVCRDFYLRSRHNNMKYSCILYNEKIDLQKLDEFL